jgi:hypothetical protein
MPTPASGPISIADIVRELGPGNDLGSRRGQVYVRNATGANVTISQNPAMSEFYDLRLPGGPPPAVEWPMSGGILMDYGHSSYISSLFPLPIGIGGTKAYCRTLNNADFVPVPGGNNIADAQTGCPGRPQSNAPRFTTLGGFNPASKWSIPDGAVMQVTVTVDALAPIVRTASVSGGIATFASRAEHSGPVNFCGGWNPGDETGLKSMDLTGFGTPIGLYFMVWEAHLDVSQQMMSMAFAGCRSSNSPQFDGWHMKMERIS